MTRRRRHTHTCRGKAFAPHIGVDQAKADQQRTDPGYADRRVSNVISLGAKTLKGGPQKPVPRLV